MAPFRRHQNSVPLLPLLLALVVAHSAAGVQLNLESEQTHWLEIATGVKPRPQDVPKRKWCRDQTKGCASLGPALYAADGRCKYPMAELCPRTCGYCDRLSIARNCQCAMRGCGHFCSSRMDWEDYFESVRAIGQRLYNGTRVVSQNGLIGLEVPGFLTEAETDAVVELFDVVGMHPEDALPKKVRDVDKQDCETPDCRFNPLVGEIYRRVSELLDISQNNFESLEFLRYRPGQHYKAHTDSDQNDQWEPLQLSSSHRVMTVFFYLSEVEEGGETAFPKAKLKVKPEKGKVFIWSNVKSDWSKINPKSLHEAVPVVRGQKLAANFWVHPFDNRGPEMYANEQKCSR